MPTRIIDSPEFSGPLGPTEASMSVERRPTTALCFVLLALVGAPNVAAAQAAKRDAISEFLKSGHGTALPSIDPAKKGAAAANADAAKAKAAADARDGDPQYEQAKALMVAVDAILKEAADTRAGASKLPSRDDYIIPPFWRETREDRDAKIRDLLDAALGIVTNTPIVDVQKKLDALRRNIHDIENQNVKLREKRLVAPKEASFPGIMTETVGSIDGEIAENDKRIDANRVEIKAEKAKIALALKAAGVELLPEQIDLLLDSVLSGDLIRLVAVFNAAKMIDGQLANLISSTGDNMNAARRYFAMHAALFAMLVRAQDATISKIDTQYLPKLDAIITDIAATRGRTNELLKAPNRTDQQRALESNRASQKIAADAAQSYRRYLQQQREQIAQARLKAVHDLKIADNTYETVEASVQLRDLMRESSTSFEAIQKLESPSFEQIFKNDELRKEFEDLTRKLDAPAS
jgi:hypothetical protein